MLTNMDKLYESVAANGPVCVGLDTEISYLPTTDTAKTAGENVVAFNRALIDATKGVAGCYKVQIAYYESLGLDGMRAYAETLKLARATGLPVIADIKRGDIAKTAEMYAKAHFTGDFEADIITLAPYMGLDSISPYLPYCAEQGKGVFVLCRTSNPGAKDFEYKKLDDGRHVYDLVGDSLTALGKDYMGEHGYSSIGLVIGGTHTEEATAIRAAYKDTFFLIPGYGAQGGKAADIAQYLTKGNGGVVNSSRGILLAYKKQPGVAFDEAAYNECVRGRIFRVNATSCNLTVLRQETVAEDIMRLTVQWQDRSREPHAGQFYMLRAWAADATPILSRPISVDDFDNQTGALTFLYQVKGEGTHKLAALKKDDTLTVTGPCGNGFDTAALAGQYKRIAVVGGGIGTAPLLLLCKELCRAGVRPDLFVGFRDTTYGMDRFVPWCRDIYAATDSGKEGHHGLVTDLLDVSKYDIVLTCGPMVMMRGVAKLCAAAGVPCLASLEKKMACGLGACLGCTCHTKIGPVTVCKDGPVFNAQEVFD